MLNLAAANPFLSNVQMHLRDISYNNSETERYTFPQRDILETEIPQKLTKTPMSISIL
jgi:hypothetical protein